MFIQLIKKWIRTAEELVSGTMHSYLLLCEVMSTHSNPSQAQKGSRAITQSKHEEYLLHVDKGNCTTELAEPTYTLIWQRKVQVGSKIHIEGSA